MNVINTNFNLKSVTNFLGFTTDKSPTSYTSQPDEPMDIQKLGEKKVLHMWEAMSRGEKKGFSQKFVRTMIVIGVVVSLLLIIMQEYFLILALGGIIFISYALSKTPPEKVTYEISSHGIGHSGEFYYWTQLRSFFFTHCDGVEMMAVDTKETMPGRLFLTLGSQDKERLKESVSGYLPYFSEAPRNIMDKAYESITQKFNF